MRQAEILDVDDSDSEDEGRVGDSHSREGSAGSSRKHHLYTRGIRSSHFTLVLQVRNQRISVAEKSTCMEQPNLGDVMQGKAMPDVTMKI